MPQCCGGRRVSGESRERRTPGPDGVAREKAEGARQRDLLVARTRDVIHDATALALVLDTRRRTLTAEGATTQSALAADLLVDERLATREWWHAGLQTTTLDAAAELALARRAAAPASTASRRASGLHEACRICVNSDAAARLRKVRVERGVAAKTTID